jgi:hypothetical protein
VNNKWANWEKKQEVANKCDHQNKQKQLNGSREHVPGLGCIHQVHMTATYLISLTILAHMPRHA